MSKIQRNVIGVVYPSEYDWKQQINAVAKHLQQGHVMQMGDAGKVVGLGQALEDAEETIKMLCDALEGARILHLEVEGDPWFSCPNVEENSLVTNTDPDDWTYCGPKPKGSSCECGAEEHNDKIEAALSVVQLLHEE
jgi:hypothetical protein